MTFDGLQLKSFKCTIVQPGNSIWGIIWGFEAVIVFPVDAMSTGRLTLTTQALYFEATGVVSYDKPKKFDLSADLKHVVKPDLTGPWGARLFDKAVMYKSSAT